MAWWPFIKTSVAQSNGGQSSVTNQSATSTSSSAATTVSSATTVYPSTTSTLYVANGTSVTHTVPVQMPVPMFPSGVLPTSNITLNTYGYSNDISIYHNGRSYSLTKLIDSIETAFPFLIPPDPEKLKNESVKQAHDEFINTTKKFFSKLNKAYEEYKVIETICSEENK
jgi:hypothetical protein